jgi:hypothetical protein
MCSFPWCTDLREGNCQRSFRRFPLFVRHSISKIVSVSLIALRVVKWNISGGKLEGFNDFEEVAYLRIACSDEKHAEVIYSIRLRMMLST